MDQDGSLKISFDEWRDFLLYAPSTTLLDIIEYWHHTTVSTAYNLSFISTRKNIVFINILTKIWENVQIKS